MRILTRALVFIMAIAAGLAGAFVSAPEAFAATITTPTGNPFVVPSSGGHPVAFTVSGTGFPADTDVYVEQCDGVAPTTTGWDPTVNCDLGSSPAPAHSNASGAVTFPSTDPNFRFTPFKNASPQFQFNCLSPTDPSPNNSLPDFRNCKIRLSTSNQFPTADQVFLNIQLPNAPAAAPGFTGTPPAATLNQAYSFSFTPSGSPAPTFAMSPASVAGGITISTAGNLHGTPTTTGSFPITVTATNGVNPPASHNYTLVVSAAATGLVECGLRGSVALKPFLTDVAPKRPKANKVKGAADVGTAAGETCTSSPAAAGATKYPVSSGSVKIKGALPVGSNCSALAAPALANTELKIKWQGINPKKNKLTTAGKTLARVATVTQTGPSEYEVVAVSSSLSASFAGKSVHLTLHTDKTMAALTSTCQSSSLAGIGFSGAGVSSITVS
jgi:hypothetical protein